jgi:hypothetical protein
MHGTTLNVAPVSTKYLSLVNSLVRKNEACICQEMHGCGSGLCWVCRQTDKGLAALYFSNQKQGKMHLWALVAVEVVEFTYAFPGFWKEKKSVPEGGRLLEQALLFLLSFFFLLVGAGLLLCWVIAAATVESWPRQASHKASVALTITTAVLWFMAPTAPKPVRSKTRREKDLCLD